MGRFHHTARTFAHRLALGVVVVGAVGCGQLLGLDEDRSRIEGDLGGDADACACDDGNPCTRDECTPVGCEHIVVAFGAAPEQVTGDCQRVMCEAGAAVTVVAEDDPPEAEACLEWSCNGDTAYSTPVTRGDVCDDAGSFCDGAGTCVECIDDVDCGGHDTCGGGGTPGFCGCAPLSCDDAALSCGAVADGCGGTLDCDNGVVDGVETDVDCGGASSACGKRCADGFACLEANDCGSGFCAGGACADAWGNSISGDTAPTANAVATNAAGAAAVVGDFTESAAFAGAALSTATRAGFLVVVDASGVLSFGVELVDGSSARDVAIDPAGNIVIVGSVGATNGGERPLVEKRDATGKPLWSLTSAGYGKATAVAIDDAGHTFVLGELEGAVTFGSPANELTLSGAADVFLVELDTAGQVVGGRTFPSVGAQTAVDLAVHDGRIAVVGNFVGTVQLGDVIYDSLGDWDAYLTLLDGLNVSKATRVVGGPSEQLIAGVAYDSSGRLFVAGSFNSAAQVSSTQLVAAGDSDIFLVRFDEGTLEPLWMNVYGDAQPQQVAAIAPDVRGGVAIAGGFAGTLDLDGAVLTSAGGMDAFFATVDENGAVRRTRRFGDQHAQHAAGVAMSPFGSVYVAGAFRGTVDFGQGPVTSVGDEDAFVAAF